jgi:hypothetical protein
MRRKRREVVVVKIYRYYINSKIPIFQVFLEGLGIEAFAVVIICCVLFALAVPNKTAQHFCKAGALFVPAGILE